MIYVAAWRNDKSGLGHYTRAKKYFELLKKSKKKVKNIIFEDLADLSNKIQYKKGNIILIDTYIFSKKIENLLRKNFKKIIVINDYQFMLPNDFYMLDPFKFSKKINHKNKFLGPEYSATMHNKNFLINTSKKNFFLILLNTKYQKFFFKIYKLINGSLNKKIVVNVSCTKIKKFLKSKKDYTLKPFVSEKEILTYAMKAEYIISSGGQTMMNLVENNQFPNIYKTSNNQNFYIKKLHENKFINNIDFKKFCLKKNKKTEYKKINKKNKLLKIFNTK